MRIAVIGATGKTGRPLVAQLLAASHEVWAFSHSGGPVDGVENKALDATDPAAVEAAMEGVDAIVSVVGGDLDNRPKTINNLIAAAKRHGISRVIGVGGAGALDGPDGRHMKDQPWFPAAMQPVTERHLACIAMLEASGLDWTFVCPPVMTPGEATGAYKHQPDVAVFGSLTARHADVAHLIVRCLVEGLYIGKRVAVAD